MPLVFEQLAKYGVALTFDFTLEDPLATGSDKFVTGTVAALPIVAGDVLISKDGGAVANTTNLPTQTTAAQPFYRLTLTATEMQAESVVVVLQDQTAPAAWRSIMVRIRTKLLLGQLDVDATAIGGNTPAMNLKGVGNEAGLKTEGGATGHGLKVKGGATSGNAIDAEAAVDGVGIKAYSSSGTNGIGFQALGRGSGAGIAAQGGATNAYGLLVQGQGTGTGARLEGGSGGGHGLDAAGQGVGHGLFARSLGTGVGLYAFATGGTSAGLRADGGSGGGHGANFVGGGAGDGLRAQAGTSGFGFFGVGAGGGSAANFGGSGAALSWDDLEGAEPTTAPADNASFRSILQHLKRNLLNRAAETAITRKIFKDDSSTTLYVQAVSDDQVTQARGKAT